MHNNPVLHKTVLFWVAITIPIAISIILGTMIHSANSHLHYSAQIGDLNSLLLTYRIPLAIAGLSIPLTAMVAALHRSEQTARQIAIQQDQNNFSNHFKHLEEFRKAINEDESRFNFIEDLWGSIESFHNSIYPLSIEGNFTADCDLTHYFQALNEIPENALSVNNVPTDGYPKLKTAIKKSLKLEGNHNFEDYYKANSLQDMNHLHSFMKKATSFSGINS